MMESKNTVSVEDLLLNQKVIVCTGSGGVGKTTLSASLGVKAAKLGLKVLVLTIDPAKRLATALGIGAGEGDGSDVYRVPGQDFKGELFAGKIESEAVFNNFIKESASDPKAVEEILNNRLYKQLSTTLSGSQEYTSIIKLFDCYQSGLYDLVILDTPPAQHAIEFLKSPEKINALFQNSVTKWFIGEADSSSNLFSKIVYKGTRTVLNTLKKVTGSDFISELSNFFTSLKGLQEQIVYKSKVAQQLLLDQRTAFFLVTSFDSAKIKEARDYYNQLMGGGYNLTGIFINRAYPAWVMGPDYSKELEGVIKTRYIEMKDYFLQRSAIYDKLEQDFSGRLKVAKIKEWDEELTGLDALEMVADFL